MSALYVHVSIIDPLHVCMYVHVPIIDPLHVCIVCNMRQKLYATKNMANSYLLQPDTAGLCLI